MWYTQTASGSYKTNTGDDMRYGGQSIMGKDQRKGQSKWTMETFYRTINLILSDQPRRSIDWFIEDVLGGSKDLLIEI